MRFSSLTTGLLLGSLFASGCLLDRTGMTEGEVDATVSPDASMTADASAADASADAFVPPTDGGPDAGTDARVVGDDGSVPTDAAALDAGTDAGVDAGTDAGVDACVPTGDEVCEGSVDENCNGMVDEGCDCVNGATRTCTPTGEACTATETCVAGAWECVDDAPSRSCNGTDDDCDGTIDEDSACGTASGCTFHAGTGVATGSSYLFCSSSVSFANARSVCQTYGYELTTIESSGESNYLRSQLSGGRWWIGLQFNVWVSGSTATYRDSGSPGTSECAVIDDGGSQDWGGTSCSNTQPFICEAPVP